MWLELARPITLLASVLSLLTLIRTAFFGPAVEFSDRLYDTCGMLVIAAAFAFLSGLTFPEAHGNGRGPSRDPNHPLAYDPVMRLCQTFPVRVFRWTAGILFVLFLLNWYLQLHYIPWRDVHY